MKRHTSLTQLLTQSQPLKAASLRVLQTTDLHGHVLAFDYSNNTPFAHRGLSRTALQIKAARAEAPLHLLLDSGDILQGSPIADRLAGTTGLQTPPKNSPAEHPVVTAMNIIGYDAITLGNHDLDFGLDYLSEALEAARFPIVSANLGFPHHARLTRQLQPYVIIERSLEGATEPLRIGVTGFLPNATLQSSATKGPEINCEPAGPALNRTLDDMQRDGADILIVLAHSSLDAAEEGAEPGLAAALARADLVLAGHTHAITPAPGAPLHHSAGTGTPVLIAGAWGAHLGQADLALTRSPSGWQVTGTTLQNLPNPPYAPECKKITAALKEHHEATLAAMAEPLGHTTRQIDSFFALVADNTSLQCVAKSFSGHVRRAVAGTPLAQLPLLSAATPFRTGGRGGPDHFCHIPAGPISVRDLDKLYSFNDTLCALKITGKALRLWLEYSASAFNRLPPGAKDAPLLDPDVPGYRFSVIPQLSYEIDLSRPALFTAEGRRIQGLAGSQCRISALNYAGRPVTDDMRFLLATSSFSAEIVTRELPEAEQPTLALDTGKSCRSVLRNHFEQQGSLNPSVMASWRFKPMAETTAVFLTSCQAEENPAIGVTFLRYSPCGSAEMRLSLAGRDAAQPLANPQAPAYIGE